MTVKTKLLIAFSLLAAVSLACASLDTLLEDPQAPLTPATSTPQLALPTNTPLPPPTDPAPPTEEPSPPAAGFGEALYADDFSDPASGWDRFNNNEGVTDYVDGSYKIAVYTESLFFWANPDQEFGDAAVEVIATKASGGDDIQYGIICRHQDTENFYALVVSADGYAAIRKRLQGGELTYLAEWTEFPAIIQGNATNLLRAECVGDRLSLFANGVLLLEAFDADLPAGDVGLLAGTFSESSVELLFDNFVVTAP